MEKGQIMAFEDAGLNISEISKKIGRSRNVIMNFIQNKGTYGTKTSPGRPAKLSPRDKSGILQDASNSSKSCSKIAADQNLEVSRWTIRRALNENPNIKFAKLKRAPDLLPQNKQNRLNFAREKISWTHRWQNVNPQNFGFFTFFQLFTLI
jgi:transposase